eukprot:98705-Prymnesium_polylepis.1
MLSSELPVAVVVFNPSATPTMRIEKMAILRHRRDARNVSLVGLAGCVNKQICLTPWELQ